MCEYIYHDDDSNLQKFNENFYDLRYKNNKPEYPFFNAILNNIKNNDKIIEFGCGTNRIGQIINNYNKNISEYVGLEPDNVRYNISKKYENNKYKFYNLFSNQYICKFPNKKFDIVIISQVIQHVSTKNAIEIISDAQKLLKEDGILLLSTTNSEKEFFTYSNKPQIEDNKINFDNYCCKNISENGLPVHFFSRETLINYVNFFSNMVVIEWQHYAFIKQDRLDKLKFIFHSDKNILKKLGQSQFILCKKLK